MTKRIKYIASAILPLLQERVGVRLLGGLLLLLASCSDNPALEQADDRVQLNLDVVETGWHGETFGVSTRSGETLEGLRAIGAARSWNFASIPAADVTALDESKNAKSPNTPLWTYEDNTYTSLTEVNNTLKGGTAGTTELTYTAGLVFSAAARGIHLVNDGSDNCIRFTGVLTILNLKAGQEVTVVVKSPTGEARTMTASNVASGSPVIPATPDKTSQTRTVANDGSLTLTTPADADINIYTISVSKAEDDGFGLYCSELSISNTQVTWDNTNGKWKIGGDYNTYWRRNQSGDLNIYAYAPYKAAAYTIPATGQLTFQAEHHSMPTYSTFLSGNNVDLLYASQTGYARNSSESAVLTFRHALAKITFGTITNNTGGTLNIKGFTIRGRSNLYDSATLDLATGKWSGHVANAVGYVSTPPPFASVVIPPLADKETIIPTMPSRELSFIPGPNDIPGPNGTLPITIEVNSDVANEAFSFDVTLEQGKNKTYNITIGKNYEVVIVEE